MNIISVSDAHVKRACPVLRPLRGGGVDLKPRLQPRHGEVHGDGHGLVLVIDVADLLDHKSEGIIPWQGLVNEMKI